MAETDPRQGAPVREVEAEGVHDSTSLHAIQHAVLTPAPASKPADERVVQSAQPMIRRFTGDKRDERVGPLRFTTEERERLRASAAHHGYKGESGFTADIALAFIDGRFTANLPLSEEQRKVHNFRAQVLRELNRIGNNVNQIARAHNGGYESPTDIRQDLTELHHLLVHIAEAMRRPIAPQEA